MKKKVLLYSVIAMTVISLSSGCTGTAVNTISAADEDLYVDSIIEELKTQEQKADILSNYTTNKKVFSIIIEGVNEPETMNSIGDIFAASNIPVVYFADTHNLIKNEDSISYLSKCGIQINALYSPKEKPNDKIVRELYENQQKIADITSIMPDLILGDIDELTDDFLKISKLLNFNDVVVADTNIDGSSFKTYEEALLSVGKIRNGSIISINIDSKEISDDITSVINLFIDACKEKKYTIVLPQQLKLEPQTETTPKKLEEKIINELSPENYIIPVTNSPFGIQENSPADSSYFSKTVFVGDSITTKLQMYVEYMKKNDPTFMEDTQFLTSQGLSVGNSLWTLNEESKHPMYKGQHLTIQDAIAQMDVENVYIMLGVNDIRGYDKPTYISKYKTLIDLIKEKSPNVNIYIQSITPGIEGRTKPPTNQQIFEYNLELVKFCLENNYNYVDVAYTLRDEQGNLPKQYCSDEKGMGLHFTNDACQKWIDYLYTHTNSEE